MMMMIIIIILQIHLAFLGEVHWFWNKWDIIIILFCSCPLLVDLWKLW